MGWLAVWLIVIAVFMLFFARMLGHFTLNRCYFVTLGQFFDNKTERTLPAYQEGRQYCEKGQVWKLYG